MRDKKPVLAVDCDDVVIALQRSFLNWHNVQYETTFRYEKLDTYDFANFLRLPVATVRNRFDTFFNKCHMNLKPEKDTLESLDQLYSQYEMHLVTSRCDSLRSITEQWFNDNNLLVYFSQRHFTGCYTDVPGKTKTDVCRDIGAIALIDDAPHHAVAVSGALSIPVILPRRPWNAQVVPQANIYPVGFWDDVAEGWVSQWPSALSVLRELHGW